MVIAYVERGLDNGRLLRELSADSPFPYMAAIALLVGGRYVPAEHLLSEAVGDAGRRGSLRGFWWSTRSGRWCGYGEAISVVARPMPARRSRPRRGTHCSRPSIRAPRPRHGCAPAACPLFLTLKTVENHLTASYKKLGISSRTQIADRLSQR